MKNRQLDIVKSEFFIDTISTRYWLQKPRSRLYIDNASDKRQSKIKYVVEELFEELLVSDRTGDIINESMLDSFYKFAQNMST